MVGTSLVWFHEVFEKGQMANLPAAFERSVALASVVSLLTVVISVSAGLGFRRRFPGSGVLFYLAAASLVMPSRFGVGLGFQFLGWQPNLFTSALGAQLTWTLPFGRFAMFAVVNRFNRSWEEAATDLEASAWQRLRYVTLPILLPGIIGVAMGAFTLSYDECARTTLTIGPKNTLPLEIYALISSATSPTLFAIGTLTTEVSFLAIIISLLVVLRLQRRRGGHWRRWDKWITALTSNWSRSLSVTAPRWRWTQFRCASRTAHIAVCWVRADAGRRRRCG
jgi:putative spermidine/putrescine transport system permease protein